MFRALAIVAALIAPCIAPAVELGSSDFVFLTELSERGFEPFATSSAGNASFGMTDGTQMYLCFIADTIDSQNQRQTVLLAELAGKTPDRSVPNIPLVCVLTQ